MILFPTNSRHLTQDVGCSSFCSSKEVVTHILSQWKVSVGKEESTILKDSSPTLLKDLMLKFGKNRSDNLVTGFKKWPEVSTKQVPDADDTQQHD